MDFSRLQAASKVTDEWKYPQGQPNRAGLLPVDQAPRPHPLLGGIR
jgi:proline iminopeptidase